jgi:hypothetical protein
VDGDFYVITYQCAGNLRHLALIRVANSKKGLVAYRYVTRNVNYDGMIHCISARTEQILYTVEELNKLRRLYCMPTVICGVSNPQIIF